MQQCYTKRRSCGGGDFWDVISTLTQDLTKARNQLARLAKEVKPGGTRLYGGDWGKRPPLQPIHQPSTGYMPPGTRAGSNLPPNCHRTSPEGHLKSGKQYPYYKSPSPERRRPVTVFGANPFGRRQPSPRPRQRAPHSGCEKPRSFEQPQPQPERAQYSCYDKPESVNFFCQRHDTGDSDSNCIKICINPRRRRCRRRICSETCRDCGSCPARLQGGGTRPDCRGPRSDCLGTQFATLLEDVTWRLRERRLNAAAAEAEVSSRLGSYVHEG